MPDLLRRAGGDNAAARITSAGAHVDDIIGTADHIEIVLNDDDGRAAIEQRLEHAQQHPHIQRVQADAWLVEHEHGIRLDAPDLAGQLQPLRLAAGEARRLLTEPRPSCCSTCSFWLTVFLSAQNGSAVLTSMSISSGRETDCPALFVSWIS